MEIGLYEDWMKPQVAKLFSMQYGVAEEDFSRLIGDFYELPFQKNKCIRIVALVDKNVIGFQSFFFWPYCFKGMPISAFQSGNSLVHPDFRGKGIFQKLLDYIENHRQQLGIEILIGFPIDASVGSLLRNKWNNLFNLRWFMKTSNLLSVLKPFDDKKMRSYFPDNSIEYHGENCDFISLMANNEFKSWRQKLYPAGNYYYFTYREKEKTIGFELKITIRKKFIKEVTIGNIHTTTHSPSLIQNALSALLKKIKIAGTATIISIAINEGFKHNIRDSILKVGFRRLNKQIYFCIKPFVKHELFLRSEEWNIQRGDIDTW